MTRLLGSLALVLGGVAWVAFALALAGKSYGDTAVGLFVTAAVVLTLLGLALLYGRAAWAAGSWGKASVILLALGVLLLAPWPLLLVGGLGFILGMLAFAITSLRTGLLPRSAAPMLIAAAILLFFFNTEDDRALLAVAPGVAFFALGARRFMSAGD